MVVLGHRLSGLASPQIGGAVTDAPRELQCLNSDLDIQVKKV